MATLQDLMKMASSGVGKAVGKGYNFLEDGFIQARENEKKQMESLKNVVEGSIQGATDRREAFAEGFKSETSLGEYDTAVKALEKQKAQNKLNEAIQTGSGLAAATKPTDKPSAETTPTDTSAPAPDLISKAAEEAEKAEIAEERSALKESIESDKMLTKAAEDEQAEGDKDYRGNKNKGKLFKTIGKGIGNFLESSFKGIIGAPVDMQRKEGKYISGAGWQSYLGANLGKTLHDEALYGKVQSGGAEFYNTPEEMATNKRAVDLAQAKQDMKYPATAAMQRAITAYPQDGLENKVARDDWFNQLTPDLRISLEKIASGKEKISKVSSMRSGERNTLFRLASLYDPKFDSRKYDYGLKYLNNLAGGVLQKQTTQINTAIQQASMMMPLIDDLNNSDIVPTNVIVNKIKELTGKPGVTNIKAASEALDYEILLLLGMVGATQEGMKGLRKIGTHNASPSQLKAKVGMFAKILSSRIDPLKEEYKKTIGEEDPAKILYDYNVESMNALLGKEKYARYGESKGGSVNDEIDQLLGGM